MSYPTIPLNPVWTDNRLDLHGIYRRENGDLMTLPMRQHRRWSERGFSYVTLADHGSFMAVAASLPNAEQYVVGLDKNGQPTPWDGAQFIAATAGA